MNTEYRPPSTNIVHTEKMQLAIPSSNVLQDWQALEQSMRSYLNDLKGSVDRARQDVQKANDYREPMLKVLSDWEWNRSRIADKFEALITKAQSEVEAYQEFCEELQKMTTKANAAATRLENAIAHAKEKVGLIGRIFKK